MKTTSSMGVRSISPACSSSLPFAKPFIIDPVKKN
jgi:hypothetical protein